MSHVVYRIQRPFATHFDRAIGRVTVTAHMFRSRAGFLRVIFVVGLLVVMLFAWSAYRDALWLHEGVGRPMGVLLPLYAVDRGVLLGEIEGTTQRLMLAMATAVVGVGLVALSVARRWPTFVCLGLALLATFSVNVLVARVPFGEQSFTSPFMRAGLEYFPDIPLVKDQPLKFIADYPKLNRRSYFGLLALHPGTHPPGGVLFLWAGDKLFGPPPAPPRPKPTALQRLFGAGDPEDDRYSDRGLEAASWWAVSVTALAVIPAYVLAASVGGAAAARRLLPLYVATPNLITFGATCMDGVFLTFTLTALAAGFLAMKRWSIVRPIVAGVALWLATFFTYAAIAVPVLMGAYAICFGFRKPREAVRMLVRAALVGVVFVALQLAAERWLGYDLRATVEAAIRRDFAGVRMTGYESFTIWRNISLGNLLAFTFGSGLAIASLFLVALFARRVPWRARAFSIAFPLAVLAMACSTLFSLEVERVWMFLTPAALIVATRAFHGWMLWIVVLALSVAQALVMEWNFNTYW